MPILPANKNCLMLWPIQLSVTNCFAYNVYATFVLLLSELSKNNCYLAAYKGNKLYNFFKVVELAYQWNKSTTFYHTFVVPICTLEDVQSVKTKK